MAHSTADELYAKVQAGRVQKLMDLHEGVAARAEETTFLPLKIALTERYRRLIGVRPDQRAEFRQALEHLHGLTVTQLIELFRHG